METISSLLNEHNIILIIEGSNNSEKLIKQILSSNAYKNTTSKVKVISADEYPEMTSLFYMYEFSDKVRIIGRSDQYGGLLNLVDAGLITEEEVFEAIMR